MDAVVIVEIVGDDLSGVTAWPETPEGNEQAKTHFKQCARALGATEAEIETFLEEGYYEAGEHQIYLTPQYLKAS